MKHNVYFDNGQWLPPTGYQIYNMPDDFERVTLTKEEADYALYSARCQKYFAQKEEEEKQRKQHELVESLRPFTAEQLKDFALQKNPHFVLDDQSRDVFNLLCQYFTNDPAFEKSRYKLDKGLLLTGPVGVGKTEMLRVFSRNKRQCFHLLSVYEIEAGCQKNGVDFYKTFTGMVPGWGNTAAYFYQRSVAWAFDDVGRESVVFDFGNKSDVVSKIIQTRYLSKTALPFSTLHLTTNLTPAEIEKRYDYAVRSRLREMFNYIQLGGQDRRK